MIIWGNFRIIQANKWTFTCELNYDCWKWTKGYRYTMQYSIVIMVIMVAKIQIQLKRATHSMQNKFLITLKCFQLVFDWIDWNDLKQSVSRETKLVHWILFRSFYTTLTVYIIFTRRIINNHLAVNIFHTFYTECISYRMILRIF